MKIRFTVAVSHEGKRYVSGEAATLPDKDAKHFVAMGYAEPVGAAKQARKQATRRAPRRAAKK